MYSTCNFKVGNPWPEPHWCLSKVLPWSCAQALQLHCTVQPVLWLQRQHTKCKLSQLLLTLVMVNVFCLGLRCIWRHLAWQSSWIISQSQSCLPCPVRFDLQFPWSRAKATKCSDISVSTHAISTHAVQLCGCSSNDTHTTATGII